MFLDNCRLRCKFRYVDVTGHFFDDFGVIFLFDSEDIGKYIGSRLYEGDDERVLSVEI